MTLAVVDTRVIYCGDNLALPLRHDSSESDGSSLMVLA